MKKIVYLLSISFIFGCNSSDDNQTDNTDNNFRQDMRNFVIGISQKSKSLNSGFVVIPQNGIELVSSNGEADGNPALEYLNAIDGNGQEDLFYGYNFDDEPTPSQDNSYLRDLLNVSKNAGKTILVTDYCSTPQKVNDSYQQNFDAGYISFAAPERSLNVVPINPPHNSNTDNIAALTQARNFLYLINPENYTSKQAFITALSNTDYDAIIMDLYFENESFTESEIAQLKQKANGGARMVICYMSIGEAEDYRYYWNNDWNTNPPAWLADVNPDWPGNFKVKYWDNEWQNIIYKNDNSYLNQIISAGFDGVYLDIIDAFEYFENI